MQNKERFFLNVRELFQTGRLPLSSIKELIEVKKDSNVNIEEQKRKEEQARMRSIQREIKDIRIFLYSNFPDLELEKCGSKDNTYYKLVYTGTSTKEKFKFLSNNQLFVLLDILISSRVLPHTEMKRLIDTIKNLVNLNNMDSIGNSESARTTSTSKLITSIFGYKEKQYRNLHQSSNTPISPKTDHTHFQDILTTLYNSSYSQEYITEPPVLKVGYHSNKAKENNIEQYYLAPIAIHFDHYYLYLHALILDRNEKGEFKAHYRQHDNYSEEDFRYLRVDRFEKIENTGYRLSSNFGNKKKELMSAVPPINMFTNQQAEIKFLCHRRIVPYVYDQFRRAKTSECTTYDGKSSQEVIKKLVGSKSDDYVIMQIHDDIAGAKLWLLSQGKNVTVLKPKSLRTEIKEILQQSLAIYDNELD